MKNELQITGKEYIINNKNYKIINDYTEEQVQITSKEE